MDRRHMYCALHPARFRAQQYACAKRTGTPCRTRTATNPTYRSQNRTCRSGLTQQCSLHDVTLKDQSRKTLLNSNLLYAKIQVRSLLRGKIYLRNIALLDTDVHIYKAHPDQPTNLQFIIDAFSSKDDTGPQNTDLRINALIVRRGKLTYDEWYHPRPLTGRFSPHHLRLSDIDANLTLKHFTRDSLNFRIRQLAAREACGWDLRHLSVRFEGNRRRCTLRDFELTTPHSSINQEELQPTTI